MYAELRKELGVTVRPIDKLLDAVEGNEEIRTAAHLLLAVLEAAQELASKVALPEENLAVSRFHRALIAAEVGALGIDREDSERCWLGTGPDGAILKGHVYQRIPGPIDQEQCAICLVMRHWFGRDGAREEARYSWNGATYFDITYGRTDEPPCGGEARIKAWLTEEK